MSVLLYLQTIRNPVFDVIFKIYTSMGEDVPVIALMCFLAWCYNKELAYKIGFVFCVGMSINQVLKITFCVPRPWILNNNIIPHEWAVKKATGYSFPSGHTQSGVMLYGILLEFFHNFWAKTGFLLIILGIAFSRMYFGVHTVFDVIGAIILGVISIFALAWVYNNKKNREFLILISNLIFCSVLLLYAWLKPYPSEINPKLIADFYKVIGASAGFFTGWYIEQKYIKYSVNAPFKIQALKAGAGFFALAVIKIVLDMLPETPFYFVTTNFIILLWCILIYPMIFKKLIRGV